MQRPIKLLTPKQQWYAQNGHHMDKAVERFKRKPYAGRKVKKERAG